MEINDLPIADLGVKQISATETISGEAKPTEKAKPVLNYPRNEELIVQSVIASEEQGYALLRALQLVVNAYGAEMIIKLVEKLETNPKLAQQVKTYIPIVLAL